jgi:hypothetical protein
MDSIKPRTAKSARNKFSLTLLGALAIIAAASIAVFAMPSANSFEISSSPSSQTVAQGQKATYAIALNRGNSFEAPVALSVGGLPAATKATFSATPVPGSDSTSTLLIETNFNGTTPTGTKQLTVTGVGNGITQTTTLTLTVTQATQPGFSLAGAPSSRWVTESDSAAFTILIARSGGFTGAVTMSASGLPAGAIAGFTYPASDRAGMTISTDAHVKPGTYPITVTGKGQVGASQVSRTTTVTLEVEEKKPFSITGNPPVGLAPGATIPLDLALRNPHNFEIYVREVAVAVDPHTTTAACSARVNFGVKQLSAARYPIKLPADSNLKLSQLGIPAGDRPAAKMLNLSTNQDACKGAQMYLQYTGMATK